MSRKQFIMSVGATCANWQWSWSFVNHEEKFVIFGIWDTHRDGLILSDSWSGNSKKQSLEHVRLITEENYVLKTFDMQFSLRETGRPQIAGFTAELKDKKLVYISGNWYAFDSVPDYGLPEEVENPELYKEGATKSVHVNAYERSAKARGACLEHYGYRCYVCGFDFENTYGELGTQFIHVHHEVPLAEIRSEYTVDPIEDLKPLCPNCHAMIHRTNPALSIQKLLDELEKRT